MDKLLMIPGPTMLSRRVLGALGTQMRAHRTQEFGDFLFSLREDLKRVFQTRNDLHVISGSSTAGMDAAISSWISPGDRVIVPVYGKFSARFRQVVAAYGGEVVDLQLPWGQAPICRQIESVYDEDVKAVALVQNETSTGVRLDLSEIGAFLADRDTLFVVDAVSSMGGDDVRTDDWGIDICVAGSQKALGCPPGLALVSVSKKAWGIMDRTQPRTYYLDLRRYRSSDRRSRGQTPFTQSESLLFALRAAVDGILEEGLENRFERHRAMAREVRGRATDLGFEMFPALEETYSSTLTALRVPRPMRATEIQSLMSSKYGVVIACGHDDYKEKMIRIAHLGDATMNDVGRTMDAFAEAAREFRS
jgi:aspartate aminotransferase-like enzyme